MSVIPLVSSDSPTLISFLPAHHLALAAPASQPIKSDTFRRHLKIHDFQSRPSTPLNPSPLAPQIRLCWPLCAFINYIYSLTYLADNKHRQEAPLSPRDRATRRVSWNRAKCYINVRRMALKVIQGHWKWHETTGHVVLPITICSKNVSILPFDRTHVISY